MNEEWPFPDDPEIEVFTLARIMDGDTLIRLVTHDAEDDAWQFLDGEAVLTSDGTLATLGEMVQLEPDLCAIADLPPGWYALRSGPGAPWSRHEGEPEA